ncbi:hypothetical protein HMPREF0765_0813 [Sphingobacterium spiritivorum ATCC 33300]|uniref:Uncharacterized protein n=1 Tax=Sphingobacterium spiritivorum ATCC 33300 TaxID=525372 RepID=C2FU31_SPHSI|nr:hypothetical protein [Sphingobacterium spiritivorum]EEI93661.1 hypothetical protein HMPREF0765_0813 [Sphingobacterium spiritivorum ATCC 33300]
MTNHTYLIYGISKGLGKALAKHLPKAEDQVYGISRSQPDYLHEVNLKLNGSLLIWQILLNPLKVSVMQ